MAHEVLKDCYISIDGQDLSAHVTSVTLDYSADMVEDTTFGQDTHGMRAGLLNWSISLEMNNDGDALAVEATLWPLVGDDTGFTVVLRRDKTAGVGDTNPNYTGTGVLESFSPLSGAVGEMWTTSPTIQPHASAPTLVRTTS
jgi:hypothetical protein